MLVPVELLTAPLTSTAVAVWVILAQDTRPDRPPPLRPALMRELGRAGSQPGAITRTVAELKEAGWLDVSFTYRDGLTRNVYRPLRTITATPQPWVEITETQRAALRDGTITTEKFRWLARWLFLTGRSGWTSTSLTEFAERYATSRETAHRERTELVELGLLEMRRTLGGGVTITASPGRLPAAAQRSAVIPPSPPHRAEALGLSGDVLVPDELLTARLTDTAFALWVILAELAQTGTGAAHALRPVLMQRLGRPGLDAGPVTKAVANLQAAGWLEVIRSHHEGKTQNAYLPQRTVTEAVQGRVELTAEHRAALTDGTITTAQFRTLARWLSLARAKGWTKATLPEYGERFGVGIRQPGRHRVALVAAGLLEAHIEPPAPTITAIPGRLPADIAQAQS